MSEKAKTPEIRFKGFADPWEQRKLGELVSYTSSSLTATDADNTGAYDLYDANNIIGKTNAAHMNKPYITVIKDGAGVGRIRRMPKNTMFIGTMGGLSAENSNLDFVYSLLSCFSLENEFTGSTIPHIYFKDYSQNVYAIPCEQEQQRIGACFSNLDFLITLHQRKCPVPCTSAKIKVARINARKVRPNSPFGWGYAEEACS